jgi:CBS domain-containing protein
MSAEKDRAIESLARAVIAFLTRHPPFDGMEDEALRFLASRLTIGYYAKAATILSPERGEPALFYIVQAGSVALAPAETYHPRGRGALGPGECFSVGALLEHRAVGSPYVAATDVFCYQLPAADFHTLLDRSPRFRDFCTRYLSSLLQESRRLLRMHNASLATEQQAMGRSLRSIVGRPAVTCPPDATIGDALRTMREEGIGSIVVVAPTGEPAGIVTRHDVLDRIALPGRRLDEAISTVMTPAPRTMAAEATAYEAALLIAQHGIRHVPVMDGDRLVGVVTERDLFALQRVGIRSIYRAIAGADGIDALKQAGRDIRSLARNLIAEGAAAEPLTLIVSTLNDTLTRRVIELERARHAIDGIDFGWLGFGSEGRYEQTIATDQDNGLVFAVAAGESADAMRARLLPFAQAVNNALAAFGYPLCKGNIMAGNPRWCLSLEEWLHRFEDWIANTDPGALLGAAIFFDLRLLYGRDELVDAMRGRVLARCAATPRFLRQMAEQAVQAPPPLGVLADFVTAPQEEGGGLDLKKQGARLFVDAARVVALSQGIGHTSTAERLRQGGTRLGMSSLEIASLVEAFFFIQMLRLRRQSAAEGGGDHPNRIDPHALNEVDRRTLKESLRQARKLQTRLALDYRL